MDIRVLQRQELTSAHIVVQASVPITFAGSIRAVRPPCLGEDVTLPGSPVAGRAFSFHQSEPPHEGTDDAQDQAMRRQASRSSTREFSSSPGVGHGIHRCVEPCSSVHSILKMEPSRHRGSIRITGQLPAIAWHAMIDEPTFADATLGRLVHNAHRLKREGHSMQRSGCPSEKVDESQSA